MPVLTKEVLETKLSGAHDTLDLTNLGLGNDDISLLVALKENPIINMVNLQRNNITASGAVLLSQLLLELPQIKHLNIDENAIGDEGLAALLSVKRLASLSVHRNGLTDESILIITKAKEDSNVKVNFEDNSALSSFKAKDAYKFTFITSVNTKPKSSLKNIIDFFEEEDSSAIQDQSQLRSW